MLIPFRSGDEIRTLAANYDYGGDAALSALLAASAARGHMTRDDLIEVARWKWKGGATRKLVSGNTEEEVAEITSASFSASAERLRIGALLSLQGVRWPMASVILHFACPGRYPILDVRAMAAAGRSTHYTFSRWMEYVAACRTAAARHGVTMRELDRALWAFDKSRALA
jgi:hypothetical protein